MISSVLLAGGCATSGADSDSCSYPAAASSAFPSTTLEDWVTYGDHAVVVRGVEELDRDGREVVRLRRERTLWSRPQAPAPAPAEMFASTRRGHDQAAAAPGHQYLLMGAWWDDQHDGRPSYVHLELLAFDDGVVGRGSSGCRPGLSDRNSGRSAVWEHREAAVVDLLDRTRPDPDALEFMDLGPDERWQHVAAER